MMDRYAIDAAVISTGPPGAFFGDQGARERDRPPGQRGDRAAVGRATASGSRASRCSRCPTSDAALAELAHALDAMGLEGVHAPQPRGGHLPRRPLAGSRSTPSSTGAAPTSSCTRRYPPTACPSRIRPGCTSSRSTPRARWRTSSTPGRFERYPNIRWQVAHLGGATHDPRPPHRLAGRSGARQGRRRAGGRARVPLAPVLRHGTGQQRARLLRDRACSRRPTTSSSAPTGPTCALPEEPGDPAPELGFLPGAERAALGALQHHGAGPPLRMSRGRIAIVGAGPGGMAAALAHHRLGYEVALYERYREIKAAGNILNLWPPPQKVLQVLGVDTTDLGAPCHTEFRRHDGRLRARRAADRGGGARVRRRLHRPAALGALQADDRLAPRGRPAPRAGGDRPSTTAGPKSWSDSPTAPTAEADVVVGADGIRSTVRRILWGEEPMREQGLHLVGGWLLIDGPVPTEGVVAHNRTTQGSYTPILHEGRGGYEWWVLEACKPGSPASAGPQGVRGGRGPRLRRAASLPDRAHAARAHAALGDPRPQAAQAVVQGPRDAPGRRRAPDLPLRRLRRGHVARGRATSSPASSSGRHRRHAGGARRPAGLRGSPQAAHRPR